MPTRAEILETLAASQAQVLGYFQGLSQQDLERPVTPSEKPGAAPWRIKDHFAHLVRSERNGQRLLRSALAGDPPDTTLRLQYPEGMPLPAVLGDVDALTPAEQERLGLAVADLNQAYTEAHHDDSVEQIAADYLAARQDSLALLSQFTDEQLAAPVPTVVGEQTSGDFFASRASHAATHLAWISEGLHQGV
jgi:hypothetical protein